MATKIDSRWYTYEDAINSDTAKELGIDNNITDIAVSDNVNWLCFKILDPLCDKLGYKVYADSIYRCPALNEKVGGVPTSDHTKGCAADISVPGMTATGLMNYILTETKLPFTQIILENLTNPGGWVHIAYNRLNIAEPPSILIAKNISGKTQYFPYSIY